MKPVLAMAAIAGGWLISGAVSMPVSAMPFGHAPQLTEEPLVLQTRWVCDRGGNCIWRGPDRRALYYGPANWRHCDYRWRTGRHGPYRQRLCW